MSTPVTVQEAKALAVQHGQERVLIVCWSKDGPLNLVHIGVTPEDSQASAALANFVLRALGYDPEQHTEEHVQLSGTS